MRMPRDFASRLALHRDCTERLLAAAKDWSPEEMEISTDPEARMIRRMVAEVLREMYRMRGFIRLSPLGPRILYGEARPVHSICPDLSDFFASKFPSTLVVIGNAKESWASLRQDGKTCRSHGPGLEEALLVLRSIGGDLQGHDVEPLWRAYYSGQLCPERRNIPAFRRRMPGASLRSARLKVEANEGVTLSDFFHSL